MRVAISDGAKQSAHCGPTGEARKRWRVLRFCVRVVMTQTVGDYTFMPSAARRIAAQADLSAGSITMLREVSITVW